MRRTDLEARYREWARTHPEVLALFRRFAADMAARRRRFGIGLLAERVRWEVHAEWAPDAAGFKLNNDYRAYVARDLIADMPELAPLLRTRRVRGDAAASPL
jgi:hypothetical protein